jgi:hypothetical protein
LAKVLPCTVFWLIICSYLSIASWFPEGSEGILFLELRASGIAYDTSTAFIYFGEIFSCVNRANPLCWNWDTIELL